jgi:biopolymer transport protein ExbD
MAFGSFSQSANQAPMAEINMIPLIDVMLVLLVIFIVTAPLLTHSVKIDLPKASSEPNITKPEHVELAIAADGTAYWNGESVADEASLQQRLQSAAAMQPQPELHLKVERTTVYERVAKVMSAAAKLGLTRIGFVTDPSMEN